MRKKSMDKSLIVLLVTTFVMFTAWVGFEVYGAYIKMDVPAGLERHMEPLNSQLQVKALDVIEQTEP